jgi:hypothetical protein
MILNPGKILLVLQFEADVIANESKYKKVSMMKKRWLCCSHHLVELEGSWFRSTLRVTIL